MPWADLARPIASRCALALALIIAAAPAAAAQDDVLTLAATMTEEWLGQRPAVRLGTDRRAPVWQGPGAMIVEASIAQRVIRSAWPEAIADARAAALLDGFSAYLQSIVIERVFDRRHLREAHSVESVPLFGGHIIWSLPPVRLSRDAVVRRDRDAALFATLDRWLGTPTLQAAMSEVARLPASRLTAPDIVGVISDASGQDLSWAFAAADSGFNYAVSAIESASAVDAECGTSCVESTVTVTRSGEGMFTGRTRPRINGFDSGDGLELAVSFASGPPARVSWDGRDASRTFRFRGPAPATAAALDPDRRVMLDANRLDNTIAAPAATNVPVAKWAARWMVWLQHTMIAYGFLA